MSRIDRFLVSVDWGEHLNNLQQVAIPNPASDHLPLSLKNEDNKYGPTLFGFEMMWLEVEGFKDKICEWWESFRFQGTSSFILGEKLK